MNCLLKISHYFLLFKPCSFLKASTRWGQKEYFHAKIRARYRGTVRVYFKGGQEFNSSYSPLYSTFKRFEGFLHLSDTCADITRYWLHQWQVPGNLGVEFLVPLEWILKIPQSLNMSAQEGWGFVFFTVALLIPCKNKNNLSVSFPFKKNLLWPTGGPCPRDGV